MKTETLCSSTPCDRGVAERPRYYPRQLITSDDLTLDQEYFRNKQRAHNRLLHGWGVVCGANVCPSPDPNGGYKPWEVIIEPGFILGPYGDEIFIDRPYVKNLRTSGFTPTGDAATESLDPWCSQVYLPQPETGDRYLAVRYTECQSRPVRVQPSGCSCEDNPCEYSRLQDGFEIAILDHCPEAEHTMPATPTNIDSMITYLGSLGLWGADKTCIECPTEPWVALAKITVGEDGEIAEIDNCECRRIVVSFANAALRCEVVRPALEKIDPNKLIAGDQDKGVILTGTRFKDGMRVNLGPGVRVDYTTSKVDTDNSGKQGYKVNVSIAADARPGLRPLTLVNPDCAMATFPQKFTVDPSAANEAMEVKNRLDSAIMEKKPTAKRASKKSRK